jgi:IS30 family transposase
LTFDNGREFSWHEKLAENLDCNTYFAKPYHSWEITDIEELKEIGVRKYSFGNAMSDAIISTIENFSKSILETKNTKELYSHDNLRTKFMN